MHVVQGNKCFNLQLKTDSSYDRMTSVIAYNFSKCSDGNMWVEMSSVNIQKKNQHLIKQADAITPTPDSASIEADANVFQASGTV